MDIKKIKSFDIVNFIASRKIYFFTFCFVIFPFGLWFGFFSDYWLRETFINEKYRQELSLPIRTPFIGTCEIFAESMIVSNDRKSVYHTGIIKWTDCENYKYCLKIENGKKNNNN